MRIGIDFDNTLICYDHVFVAAARQRGLIPSGWTGQKNDLRDHLRSQPGGEQAWQGLQGWVYGKGIGNAEIFTGVHDFLAACRQATAQVFIVSHKTEFGHHDPDRINLRDAARGWLHAAGLLGADPAGLAADNVYFENTLAAKVERLASLDLDIFIDDLIDVFEQPHFPRKVRSILFADPKTARAGHYQALATWAEIQREVFAT